MTGLPYTPRFFLTVTAFPSERVQQRHRHEKYLEAFMDSHGGRGSSLLLEESSVLFGFTNVIEKVSCETSADKARLKDCS
jgi:hypothetical protein